MNGIEIRVSQRKAESNAKHSVTEFIFLMAGVYGILSFFGAVEGIVFTVWIVYPLTAVICWLAWYLTWGRRKTFFLFAFADMAVCGVIVFSQENMFRKQIGHIMECISRGHVEEALDVTETMLLFSTFLVFFIIMSEFLFRSHEVLYLFTMLAILLSPSLGIQVGAGTILLIALFQNTFWVIQDNLSPGVKAIPENVERFSLSGSSSGVTALIFALIFLVALPGIFLCAEGVYDSVYSVEGQVRSLVRQAMGLRTEPVAGGRISNGNNYPMGTVHLALEASEKPQEMLYLRGFAGGDYIGGDWGRSEDEVRLLDIMAYADWEELTNLIESRYDGMYYVMNANMRETNPPQPITLTLWHFGGAYDNLYVPYYSLRSPRYYRQEGDDTLYDYGYGNTREGYVYCYYQQSDMGIDWDNVSVDYWTERDWFMEMQEAYMEEIQGAYTKVPIEILPRLTKLCGENPLSSLNDITTFILHTLESNAVYTMTPGWSPINEDIVEYFLFEGGRGYCEHFAATATLMYRLYGIPARYATGYLVSPEDFTRQENGSWKASVTDEAAHAWTEIFLENYGWTPVEVTPGADGRNRAAYPGFDYNVFTKIRETQGWEKEDDRISAEKESGNDSASLPKWEMNRYLGYVPSIVCLMPLALDYRRLRRLRKLERTGCRKVFARLLLMLRSEGILEEYDGSEEDFAQKLGGITSVSEKDIARMQTIVCRVAFGVWAPEPEEEDFVRRMYLRLAEAVYARLNWRRKLIFRYGRAFC